MKKIICLLACSLNLFVNLLQAQDCKNPISQADFQNTFNQVAVMPTNEAKLIKASSFLNNACMMSAQVKQMSQLFTADGPRLDYCKQAYLHTFDRVNFYEVYDAFSKFSMMMRLHDYVISLGSPVVNNTPPVSNDPVFPNFVYPSPDNYNGKKGCPGPVIQKDTYWNVAKNVWAQPTDESKFVAIQNACDQYCLSMTMMIQVTSFIQQEGLRSKILINNFYHLYDQEHYDSGVQLFTSDAAKNEWITYAKAYLTPPPPVCVTSDEDFKKIMADFEKQHFSDDKLKMYNVVAKDHCFSTEQVRTISKQFPFGEEKMKVFKGSYGRCTDRGNYYKLVDELTFSAEKDELRNYIKNN